MDYEVTFAGSAKRDLKRLERRAEYGRLITAIAALGSNPRPHGSAKLTGVDAWRIRVGDYRVIYEIHDGRLVVVVVRVALRDRAY